MAGHLVPYRVSPWLVALVALLCILGLFGCTLSRRPEAGTAGISVIHKVEAMPAAALSRYAGNQACSSCHPREFKVHAASEHAHAMSRVTAATHGAYFRQPSGVVDPQQGIRYVTGVNGDRCVLTAVAPTGRTEAEATYGFGSGKHGITYLGRQGDTDLELRLSFYPEAHRWAFSPGQQLKGKSGGVILPTGLVKAAESVEGCFVCHGTAIAKENQLVVPDISLIGVGCESCHGPGKEHIAAVNRGDRNVRMAKLGQLNGQQLSQQVCGQCHRSPAGDDLNDPFNRGQLSRFQGLALSQSLCFTNSGGKLSCISCHDPHDQTPPSRTVYNGKCVSCHDGAAADHRVCRIDPKGDCVSCHMPSQSVGMPFGLSYRTHWIKVWTGR